MAERIPQSVAYLVVFRAYLTADGLPATGKTIAVTISKNGATSFSNPNAGATNATEMASGFYKFTLDTTDTNTVGPLAWRGAEGTINDAGDVLSVSTDAGTGASQASVDALQADVDALTTAVAAIENQTDDIGVAGAGLTAIPWSASWDAEVQSEVADALAVLLAAAQTLPAQEALPLTPSILQCWLYVFKFLRNEIEQTATETRVMANDGVTVDHKAPISKTSTLFTRGKFVSGP